MFSLLPNSEHYEANSEHYEANSEHYEVNSEHYEVNSEHYERLKQISTAVRETGRAKQEDVKKVILQLCSEHYLSLRTIAELLGRKPNSVRNHYVNPMLDEGLLELKYPDRANHPQQAYKTGSPPTP